MSRFHENVLKICKKRKCKKCRENFQEVFSCIFQISKVAKVSWCGINTIESAKVGITLASPRKRDHLVGKVKSLYRVKLKNRGKLSMSGFLPFLIEGTLRIITDVYAKYYQATQLDSWPYSLLIPLKWRHINGTLTIISYDRYK